MASFFLSKCPKCKTAVKENWNFCKCGIPIRDLRRVCPHCHRIVEADADSCVHCGSELESVQSLYSLIRWSRTEGEYVRRITVGDLAGALSGGVIVDHGTRALFLVDGVIKQVLDPGWEGTTKDPLSVYSAEEYVHRIEVIAIDAGDTSLHFRMGARTSDSYRVSASLGLHLSLADGASLVANLLKAKERLTFKDLETWLLPEVEGVLRECLAGDTLMNLEAATDGLRRAIEDSLRAKLDRPLAAAGLRLERLGGFEIESPRLTELLKEQELGALIKDKAREAQKRLADLERLQDSVVRRKQIDDNTKLKLEKSGILTKAEIQDLEAEIARHQDDEDFGWRKMREILEAKHKTELDKVAAESGIELIVARQHAEIDVDRKRREMDAELTERDREHKLRIGVEARKAREEERREWLKAVKGMDPEAILAASAAETGQAAEALKAKYEHSGAKEREELLREMQEKLLQSSEAAQNRAFRLAEKAVEAKNLSGSRPCPKCQEPIKAGASICPHCKSVLA